ncbi:MAG: proline iminopeptidase-family hydrolase [Methanomassiliicoccales archaeon]|nr:proline iminopeptidase-family hydrolase [Methanomassiliicoccales archaeon]
MAHVRERKGHVRILGHRLFYRLFGDSPFRGTVVCLHGGPGATHDYLLPMADLAGHGYRVLLYDQLGCGKSELPPNTSLFTIERGVEELEELRKVMRLGRIHLMGSSYGGLLALAYALKYQRNLLSIVTVGGIASVPLTISEMERLKSLLPARVKKTLTRYEEKGEFSNPDYLKAVEVFYRRHLCRLPVWPDDLIKSMNNTSLPVYGTMNGPNEFTITGNIRYWDISSRLGEIRVPVLVTGGRYDEVTPRVARQISNGIRNSRLVIFRNSSHLPMWEERERFISRVADFLDGVSRNRQS